MFRQEFALDRPITQIDHPFGAATTLHLVHKRHQFILRQGLQPLLDSLALLLESLHDSDACLLRDARDCYLNWLWQGLTIQQINLCSISMCIEVEARTICNTHALKPAIAGLNLRIPAICCVVSHLRRQVLSKATMQWLDANAGEEEVSPNHEVTKRFIVHNAFCYRLTNRRLHVSLTTLLQGLRKQLQLDVCHEGKLAVLLCSWLYEPLHFSLCEFTLSRQPLPWRNLIPKRLANLGNSKGQAVGILLQTVLVVQEDALCCLRSQVALNEASWSNWSWKHEVERLGLGKIIAAVWRFDLILLKDLL
mmetsp:Transcript_54840/g.101454  ORF Transcript_54840/g.101454 Transcript_54840/m.101454 type:complete len:307 (+) Transcript_54840:587-1507(+)